MNNSIKIILLSICSLSIISCNSSTEKTEITVSAASSLYDSLIEIKGLFEQQHSDMKIIYNFGSTGALQQQILQGAPIDLFFSASEEKFQELNRKGFIDKKYFSSKIGNELVLVVTTENMSLNSIQDLLFLNGHLSIGTPETVPAGFYAKESLHNLGIYAQLEDKIIYAKDVKQVLSYVESENVEAGIVYKTDAQTSSNVRIVDTFNQSVHSPIKYSVGVLQESPKHSSATIFFDFLQSDEALSIFEKNGFSR